MDEPHTVYPWYPTRNSTNGHSRSHSPWEDNFLPAVATLLRLSGTIPVSNATAERSFSALKRLKTYLCSTMAEERLTGLALLHVNKLTEVDPDDIIEVYAGKKELMFPLSTFIVFMTICNIICEIIKSDSGISYILFKNYEVTEVQLL